MPRSTPRTHELTADRLRRFIAAEQLQPGMRLPNEHKLATTLGTSRPTLREGLLALEIAGEIEIRNGSGVYVTDARKPYLIDIDLKTAPGPMEFLDARLTIECRIASEAALTATPDDIHALQLLLANRKAGAAPTACVAWDKEFHIGLAEATGQTLLSSIVGGLIQRLDDCTGRRGLATSLAEDLADHETILEAIRERDPLRAGREMRKHLNRAREALLGHAEDTVDLSVPIETQAQFPAALSSAA